MLSEDQKRELSWLLSLAVFPESPFRSVDVAESAMNGAFGQRLTEMLNEAYRLGVEERGLRNG